MKNKLKEKMARGEKALGTFVWMGGAPTVEALSYTGLDFLIVDNEHGPFEIEDTIEMFRAAGLSEVTPCVRITEITRSHVLKPLDIGAEAIIVPDVRSVDEVRALVRYAKYAPMGERGIAFARKAGYGYADVAAAGMQEYFETCNRETMLFPQCETKECADNIEEIVALEGVDGIFIGPYDLSASLGAAGDFESPVFRETFDHVCKAVKEAGKYLMIFTFDKEEAQRYFANGADAVVYSSDVNIMVDAFRSDVQAIVKH